MKKLLLAFCLTAGALQAAPKYPSVVDPARVGKYPSFTASGGGMVYDDVLEYRVWRHTPKNGDAVKSFTSYEKALAYARKTERAEMPIVLVRQLQWIDEPSKGHFVQHKELRLTEWNVKWLASGKRTPAKMKKLLGQSR